MKCPECGCDQSEVTNSKPHEDGYIRRRRVCCRCKRRFSTVEISVEDYDNLKELAASLKKLLDLAYKQ